MVNAWRAAPATCQGKLRRAVPVLTPKPVLSRIALRPGVILLATLDSGEMTPKFALSAAAVLRRRAGVVDELCAQAPGPHVLRAQRA